VDEFRVVKHTRTRKIYEIYTDRITAAPLASPVPCAAWGPEAGRWAAPQALQRRPLPERMLLGDPWCWWLALPTQSYSSAGRSAISILFPFRNRACKIFFFNFFFSVIFLPWVYILLLLSLVIRRAHSGLILSCIACGRWQLWIPAPKDYAYFQKCNRLKLSILKRFSLLEGFFLSHILKQIWYSKEDYLDVCQFLGSQTITYTTNSKKYALSLNIYSFFWVYGV